MHTPLRTPMHTSWPAARLRFRLCARLARSRFPRLPRSDPYFVVVLINAIGYGLFTPISVLYFHFVVGLSLPVVGLGLSLATGCSLMSVPLCGLLIDRFGARPVAVMANLLSAAGFVAYLGVHSVADFLLAAAVVAIGMSGGGTASSALVVDLVAPRDRDRWYGLMRMISNAGTGAGALLAGALIAGGGTTGYRWLVGLNAISYVLAAALLLLVRPLVQAYRARGAQQPKPRRSGAHGTYRAVLQDHRFLGLLGAGALVWMSMSALEVALPPYLLIAARAPTWTVGLLFTLNTGVIVLLQVPLLHVVATRRRTRTLAAGAFGFGGSYLLFAAAPLLPPNAVALYLCGCMLVYTVAEIIYVPTFAALVATLIPVGMQGRYLAISHLSRVSAATIMSALSGSLLAIAPQGLWLLLFPLTLGSLALLRRLERRLPEAALRAASEPSATPPSYRQKCAPARSCESTADRIGL